ncbi:hypothetical protein BH11ACT8_BH11ACT8_17730 [soil metagenome]
MSDGRFDKLPEPIRLEDTVTSQDSVTVNEPGQDLNEVSWLLKNAAG